METVLAELSRLTVAHPVAQAIGLAALVATCLSYLARETRGIALRQGVASCLWTAHLLMLGAWTGGLMTLLGAARGAVYSQRGVSGWASARGWPWAFGALCVTGAAWAGMAQGEGSKILLSCGAQCIGCYALWTSNVSRSRRLLVLACILWLSYDALSGSLPGVVCEAASLGSLVVAMFAEQRGQTPNAHGNGRSCAFRAFHCGGGRPRRRLPRSRKAVPVPHRYELRPAPRSP